MNLLLDENLPVKLKYRFSTKFIVSTVTDLKWNSLKDAELLKSVGENRFDAFITSDKNIVHQQNLSKYSYKIIIIFSYDNQYQTILTMVPLIEMAILSGAEQVVLLKGH